jgi:Rrf2 family protein
MKLSTRSRYGTRMLLEMARHYNQGPLQLGEIAKRQNISLKYLEQIIRPLKQADYISSVRGPKGGHMLNKAPSEITIGEIVALLEGGASLTACSHSPRSCDRVDECLTRLVWIEAADAVFERLGKITLKDLLDRSEQFCKQRLNST